MLTFVKILHTLVWAIMATAVFYILYAGITKTYDLWLWISLILLSAESLVLMLNRWACPLTSVAARYTAVREPNFDIYLPRFLAQYNKQIFGSLFILSLILLIFRYFII